MNQILFPLIIVNVLREYASKENPVTVSQVLDLVNRQYAPFTDRTQVMNRSTVVRTLDSLANYTEVGNLLDFRIIEEGTVRKKRYYMVSC